MTTVIIFICDTRPNTKKRFCCITRFDPINDSEEVLALSASIANPQNVVDILLLYYLLLFTKWQRLGGPAVGTNKVPGVGSTVVRTPVKHIYIYITNNKSYQVHILFVVGSRRGKRRRVMSE